MSAEELLSHLAQGVFVALFVVLVIRAARNPRRSNIDAAAFFGLVAIIVAISWAYEALGEEPPRAVSLVTVVLLIAIPYPLLRLADGFTGVPGWVLRLTEVGLVACAAILIVSPDPYPGWVVLTVVAYFVAVVLYAALRFVVATWRTSGVTRRRLQLIAAASALLAGVLLFAGLRTAIPEWEAVWNSASSVCTIVSAIFYFLGFAPPTLLKRGWQSDGLGRFIRAASSTPLLAGSLRELTGTLEAQVSATMGGGESLISIWNDQERRFDTPSMDTENFDDFDTEVSPIFEVYQRQRAVFIDDAERADPTNAETYRRFGTRVMLVAPVTVGMERIGLLAAYGARAPLFAEDDVELLEVLAQQVAVILRDRRLVLEAAETRAQEETLKLKDDFLSAAAHDLKTPLTTLVAQSQMMQRRLQRDPAAPADAEGINRMAGEAQRMRRLVEDLLDASRSEQSGFLGATQPLDLLSLSREVAETTNTLKHGVTVHGSAAIVIGDRDRLRQVVANLLDNAIKYSPDAVDVRVVVSADGSRAYLAVTDEGVGIPDEDKPVIFERFQRGSRLDDRRFSGLGLGLYLCKRIVEEHGGTISVTSEYGQGSTFQVALPLAQAEGGR